MPLLQVQSVEKSYGEVAVLRGVSFEVEAGGRVALMGPSGSGKSTLLNCLGGIDRPDSGSILLEDANLCSLTGDQLAQVRRTRISTVFQFFHLLPTLTASENVEFPLQLLGVAAAERAERVGDLMKQVGLSSRAHALPDELSGGEMQRVAIARALVVRPGLILADEPTGNLDSTTGDAVLGLLEELAEQYRTALIMVTHSRDATRICHQVLRMRDGQVEGEV